MKSAKTAVEAVTYYTYMVLCSKDQSLYAGVTNDLDRRITEHNTNNRGAKYTRSRRPVMLVYSERYSTKSAAMKREAAIKKLSRKNKLKLVEKME